MKTLKKSLKIILKSPIIITFALICVFLLPTSINTLSVAFRSAIAVAVGIDKNEIGQIELQVAINTSAESDNLAEHNYLLTSVGRTVADAFTNLDLEFGRSIKLGHTRFVMIGKGIGENDVVMLLDGLVRTGKMRSAVQLVYSNDSIKDLFDVGIELNNSTGIKVSEIVCHQQDTSTTSIASNIDSFYRGFFNPSGISKLNTISLGEEYYKGLNSNSSPNKNSQSSSENEGQNTQSIGNEQKSSSENIFITNKGEIAIFKNGVYQMTLTKELTNGLNWLNNEYNIKKLYVNVEKSNNLENAIVNFDILSKKVNLETFFYKNIPFVSAKVVLSLDVDEVISKNTKTDFNYNIIDDSVKSIIGDTVRSQISTTLKVAKDSNLDLFEINNLFHKRNYLEYVKYLDDGNNSSSVLQNTIIAVDVQIKIV